MELSPLPGIRALSPATASPDEREVQPPFALEPSGRMGDDAYNRDSHETERGLEEENDGVAEEADSLDTLSSTPDSEGRVNFFA